MAAGYWFKIPNLPKNYYEFLVRIRRAYKMSPWQLVILALACLQEMGQEHSERVGELAEEVHRRYPAEYK